MYFSQNRKNSQNEKSMRVPVLVYLILSQNVLHESLQKLILRFVAGLKSYRPPMLPRVEPDWMNVLYSNRGWLVPEIPYLALWQACMPVENHKVNAELIFAAIHAKRFDSESDIQVQVRAWIFHFDCFFDSDWNTHTEIAVIARLQGPRSCSTMLAPKRNLDSRLACAHVHAKNRVALRS